MLRRNVALLGDGALQKYGVMVMTHSSDATDALKQSLEALPAENYGHKMLGLVGGRLLSCEARAWRQSRIRESVLQQVLEMHVQNDCHAADPEMLQWARLKQLEAAKLEVHGRCGSIPIPAHPRAPPCTPLHPRAPLCTPVHPLAFTPPHTPSHTLEGGAPAQLVPQSP